eukprot:scaffold9523_cov103-Cylindrotheca_fusiformis.AAC.5
MTRRSNIPITRVLLGYPVPQPSNCEYRNIKEDRKDLNNSIRNVICRVCCFQFDSKQTWSAKPCKTPKWNPRPTATGINR